jgi:hypothetical protein
VSTLIVCAYISSAFLAFWLASYVLFFQNRQVAIEETRQRLFEVRDRLFQLGVNGRIPFSSQAHERLRTTINCSIRFIHDLSATRLVLGAILDSRKADWRESAHAFMESNYEGLEGNALDEAKLIVRDMHYWLVVHTIKSSVVLCILSATYFALHLARETLRSRHSEADEPKKESVAEAGDFGALAQGYGYVRKPHAAHSCADDIDGEQRRLRAFLHEYVVPRVEEGGVFIPVEREALEHCLAHAA